MYIYVSYTSMAFLLASHAWNDRQRGWQSSTERHRLSYVDDVAVMIEADRADSLEGKVADATATVIRRARLACFAQVLGPTQKMHTHETIIAVAF